LRQLSVNHSRTDNQSMSVIQSINHRYSYVKLKTFRFVLQCANIQVFSIFISASFSWRKILGTRLTQIMHVVSYVLSRRTFASLTVDHRHVCFTNTFSSWLNLFEHKERVILAEVKYSFVQTSVANNSLRVPKFADGSSSNFFFYSMTKHVLSDTKLQKLQCFFCDISKLRCNRQH